MPAKSRAAPPPRRMNWLLKCALLFGCVVLFLASVIWAGQWARDEIQGSDRYGIRFSEIECETPVGMERLKFLDEVRYYASPKLSEKLTLIDEKMPAQLSEGFARHPWVEKVVGVEIHPPRQVHVRLTFRVPVLAVKVGLELLAVDGAGVLLPKNAPTAGLPLYEGDARDPHQIGQRWGDPNVEAAARKRRK
jgi:hypothetical protein